ncbi:hypothetical protein CSX04_06781 [Burkholderia cepacia]|nr:hypothetical protein CSX04_06781 [Burkholderia cepacia]
MTYLLPQQIADLQDMLGQFVAEVFSVSSYEPMPMLRGVYLTSGTQEGTAFDRVMSGIKRFLKIEGVPPVAQVGSTGRSFFLKSLLQEHIFREASLAGSDLRWHQKRRVLQIAGYVLLALVCVAVLVAWLRSYSNNRAYLDQIGARVPAVDAQIAGAKFSDAADVARLLPVLDALGGLANTGGVDLQHPPLAYRWGLFQGEKIDEAVDAVYRRALEDVLLPIAASRMEAALRDARPDETEFAYAALKAYLMLYDSAHYDPAFVQAVVDLEMERALPPDFSPAERTALRAHLAALFGGRVAVSPYPMNERLVADVRDRLRQVPFSQRLYRQLTLTLRPATAAFDFSVARAVGPDASLVFRRQGGKPLSEGVPGLYTRNGYRNVFAPRLAGEVDAYGREEVWVLNLGLSEIPGPNDAAAWARDIRQLYLNDYLKIWDDYLADIKLQRTATLAQSIQVARALSSADSPLTRLMVALARDTALGDAPGGGARNLAARAQDKVDEARSSLSQIFASQGSDANTSAAAPASAEQIVDSHFAGLRTFVPGSGDQAQAFNEVLKSIDALYTYLTATDDALRSGAQPPPSDAPAKLRAQAGRLPTPFREVLDDLSNVANGSVATVEQRSVATRAARTSATSAGRRSRGAIRSRADRRVTSRRRISRRCSHPAA